MFQGLESAVKELLPNIEHRMCARHIFANWAKKWRGEDRRLAFWVATKSTFKEQLKANL